VTFVEGCHVHDSPLDLSTVDAWSIALDQRAFGPRQVLVVTASADGRILGLAHCERTDPPEIALRCCLATLDDGAAAAVAYSDEPVMPDPSPDLPARFATARAAAREHGVHLVDWLLCDDTEVRSMRLSIEEVEEWWDIRIDHP
jgi:hypothetical protein